MSRYGFAFFIVVASMACVAAGSQPAQATLAETVERYCRSYEKGDADSILGLYQENAFAPDIASAYAQRIRVESKAYKEPLQFEVIKLSEMGGKGYARLKTIMGDGTSEETQLNFKLEGQRWVIIENYAAGMKPDPVILNELSATMEKAKSCQKPTLEEREQLMGRSVALFLDANSGNEAGVLAQFSNMLPIIYTSGWDTEYELKQIYRKFWKGSLTAIASHGTRRVPLLQSAESAWTCQVYWKDSPNAQTPLGQAPIGQFKVFAPYLEIALDPSMNNAGGKLDLGRPKNPGGVCIIWIRTSNGFQVLDMQPCNGLNEASVLF